MKELEIGDPAPGFELSDQHGGRVALEQLSGSKLLIYFYPRASTPG